jgi:predicted O-linked N-acetylglucosamine transferase (SPINDLY family)
MDYRITDSHHDPPGLTEMFHTEQLVRLDPCCWCYQPDADGPEVNPLPALSSGGVTFAALNRLIKTTPKMIRIWATVLDAVPGSRLMVLVSPRSGECVETFGLFEKNGIKRDRLLLVPRAARRNYLEQYHRADVALDTFPYSGHTTTCDALWMGVPVITLAGDSHVSRAGVSVLSAVQLESLVSRTANEYLERATALATNLDHLAELRRALRERTCQSTLMDVRGLTARLEAAYRRMTVGQ